ncbi:hypothetical protein [Bdellovibrio bacteriovorus]|uniref:hypothetical protein n=1 Tax=Bdellovibrio TaxID=958 RepID=UPI0035A8A85A
MKALFGFALLVLLSGCSHTINFRASHFAVPVTGENQWSGHVAAVGTAVTKITVVNNIETNPPTRDNLKVNDDVDIGDLMMIHSVGIDASLTILKSLDITLDNSLFGLRYQFLNHGAGPQNWVASIQGAYGQRDSSTSEGTSGGTTAEAKSKVTTSQAGISLGYKLEKIVPYISYIYESHEVKTDVTNTHGAFGPYNDKGIHQYYGIGLASHGKGLVYGIEYNRINIDWDRAINHEPQDALGIKFGFAW